MYDGGTFVFRNPLGEVRNAFENFQIQIMKVELKSKNALLIRRKIDISKTICKMDTISTSNQLSNCKSNLIPSLLGCVEEEKNIYILQESIANSLKDEKIVRNYRLLNFAGRAKVMIIIINKFQQLHDLGFVHNDINPASILLKDEYFEDIRIDNFWQSGTLGEFNEYKSSMFCDPLKYKTPYVNYQGDIYSLAMTFAVLESGGLYAISSLPKDCIEGQITNECKDKFREVMERAFSKDKLTKSLIGIMVKATSLEFKQRYQSMNDFGNAISNILSTNMFQKEIDQFIEKNSLNRNYYFVKIGPTRIFSGDKKNIKSGDEQKYDSNKDDKKKKIDDLNVKENIPQNNYSRVAYNDKNIPQNKIANNNNKYSSVAYNGNNIVKDNNIPQNNYSRVAYDETNIANNNKYSSVAYNDKKKKLDIV